MPDARLTGPGVIDRMCIACDEGMVGNEAKALRIGLARQPPVVENLALAEYPELDAAHVKKALLRQAAHLLPRHRVTTPLMMQLTIGHRLHSSHSFGVLCRAEVGNRRG